MFYTNDLKKYNLIDNGKVLGIVHFNPDFNWSQETTRPFIRCKLRLLENVGRVNYLMLDQFIISSLNDYYNKFQMIKEEETRKNYITQYQQLYYLWQKVAQAKQNRDPNLNVYYDDLIYRLYILGYRN